MPDRTEAQQEASRQNGARSKGPKTGQGKLNSAKNSYKHGAYSTSLLMWGDDEEAFFRLEKDLKSRYNPQGETESVIFHQMLAAMWRLQRIPPSDVSMHNIQMQRMCAAVDTQFETVTPMGRYALAFTALHSFGDGPVRLARQERRLFKQYQDYRRELEYLQRNRPQPQPPTAEETKPPEAKKEDETNPRTQDAPTDPHCSLYAYLPPIQPKMPPAEEVAKAASSAS